MISTITNNINTNIQKLKPSATLAINEKSAELVKKGKTVYRFGFGQSPFPVPNSVVQSLIENAHQKDYLPVKGMFKLREAVAAYNHRKFQINSSPEDILIGPGSKELLFLLQVVFDGDLLLPAPSWVTYEPQGHMTQKRIHWLETFETDDWMLQAETLRSHCHKNPNRPAVLILNYPSNPTGASLSETALKAISEVASQFGVIVLADEIYGDLHHLGKHQSLAKFYPEGTIVSGGLSKWCGAGGWRLGTFSFPKNLRWLQDAMAKAASETFSCVSAPVQYAAVTAFEGNEEIEEYLSLSRIILSKVSNTISTELNEMEISHPLPVGGFYLLPNFEFYRESLAIKRVHTSTQLCNRLLEETGVALLPGVDFGFEPNKLLARLSFVDFNGKEALEKAAANDFHFDKNAKMMIGLKKMKEWLST